MNIIPTRTVILCPHQPPPVSNNDHLNHLSIQIVFKHFCRHVYQLPPPFNHREEAVILTEPLLLSTEPPTDLLNPNCPHCKAYILLKLDSNRLSPLTCCKEFDKFCDYVSATVAQLDNLTTRIGLNQSVTYDVHFVEDCYTSEIPQELRELWEGAKPTPAANWAVEKLLQRVEFVDDDEGVKLRGENCAICLDDLEVGMSKDDDDDDVDDDDDDGMMVEMMMKMPCEHVFHGKCIVDWLRTSHFCPLCRYKLPVDDF